MLQTWDVGFVSRRERAPDTECCTQHGSQHGRDMGGRNTLDVGCCT
jgi:hypothetical protein